MTTAAVAAWTGERHSTPAWREGGRWPAYIHNYRSRCLGSIVWIGPYRLKALDRADAERHLRERRPDCEFRTVAARDL